MKELNRVLSTNHHFTTPYCPWSNGTVERLNREIKKVLKVILSEFRMHKNQWPLLLGLAQYILNSTKLKRLVGHCPITVFTGLEVMKPLNAILDQEARIKVYVTNIRQSLDQMHKEVIEIRNLTHEQNCRHRKMSTKKVNFCIGDFVLCSQPIQSSCWDFI
jgi:hypothetical protein